MIKGAIFDMDGTLLNSMDYWAIVAEEFLKKNNLIARVGDNRRFLELGMKEFYNYVVKEYGVTKSHEDVRDEIYSLIEGHYKNDVDVKVGAREMLELLSQNGVKMCLATATDRPTVEMILKKLGIEKYFSRIFTTSEVGIGKSNPKIFELALEFLGTKKEETYIFEDAYYAINTAHSAGFNVVGIYDKNAFVSKEEMSALCTIYSDENDEYRIISSLLEN